MQVPIRLSDVKLGITDIDILMSNLAKHGMTKLGEHGDISLDVSREILMQAL
jgi:NADP-dependent alcohol dehydrogenase